jgi:hypothetical protein
MQSSVGCECLILHLLPRRISGIKWNGSLSQLMSSTGPSFNPGLPALSLAAAPNGVRSHRCPLRRAGYSCVSRLALSFGPLPFRPEDSQYLGHNSQRCRQRQSSSKHEQANCPNASQRSCDALTEQADDQQREAICTLSKLGERRLFAKLSRIGTQGQTPYEKSNYVVLIRNECCGLLGR